MAGPPDLEAVTKALRDFIAGEVLLRKGPLSPDEDLFDAGFDSLSISRTLVFVEERFQLMIPDVDVVLDEIATLAKMSRFVHARLLSASRG